LALQLFVQHASDPKTVLHFSGCVLSLQRSPALRISEKKLGKSNKKALQQPLTEGMIAYVGAYIAIVGEDGMDRALQNGNQSSDGTTAEDAMTLEAVELEFALGAIDVLIEGFDSALAKAAERVGGEVLFNMPALDTSKAQRIGAIAIAGQPEDQVIFVTLRNDGTTLSVEPPTGENAVFESLGRNYAAVMKSLSPKEKVNGA